MSSTLMRVIDICRSGQLGPENVLLGERALELYLEDIARYEECHKELTQLRAQMKAIQDAIKVLKEVPC